jgi:hypothetical protein
LRNEKCIKYLVVILKESEKFGDAAIDEGIILIYLLNTHFSGCYKTHDGSQWPGLYELVNKAWG